MRKNLVICDKEFRYAESLGENISEREDLAVRVHVCSNLERVIQLSLEHPIHILLVDEAYSYEERSQVKASQTFVLVKGERWDETKTEWPIYKYRRADEIIREIFETYIKNTDENVIRQMRRGEAKIIAVYSPIHRVGKTTFAMALGRELAKEKKTLYLNMEEYAGFADEDEQNLGDLLYYMRQGNQNLGMRLQLAVNEREGLFYLAPIPMAADLKEITFDEWECLLENILQNSSFERIILDVGESVQGLFQVLELCDRVYMPILKDEFSERKIRQFDRNLERLKLTKLPRILYRFLMPENIEEYAKLRKKEEC